MKVRCLWRWREGEGDPTAKLYPITEGFGLLPLWRDPSLQDAAMLKELS